MLTRSSDEDGVETEDSYVSLGKHMTLETVAVDNSQFETLLDKKTMRFIGFIVCLSMAYLRNTSVSSTIMKEFFK